MTMHDGHRKRMRERFRQGGLEGFAPHEVLELLLFYGRARGDVNGLAHELLATFGSLRAVLEARPEQLMAVSGVGEETATLITFMLPLLRRYSAEVAEERKRIHTRQDAKDYAKAILAGYRSERFMVVCLDAKLRVLGQTVISEGSLDAVNAYPRRVVEAALNHNACSVIFCHNHPGGLPTPSQADLDSTRILQRLLHGLGIVVHDHVIVSGDKCHSMVEHGEITYPLTRQFPVAMGCEEGLMGENTEGLLEE